MKIASIVGTRPNFIKMSPVIREIESRGLDHILIHTGQHYDGEMSEVFFNELELSADYFLSVGSGTHGYQTGLMLIKIEEVLLREQPDVVLVPGDTNTALAGALAAAKLHMPVGHVEAGLRSFDGRMPEEINRILVDHSSEYLFSPTKSGVGNLRKEGIPEEKIFLTGDTMVEACFQNLKLAEKESNIEHELPNEFILATLHRAENVDDYSRLKNVVDSFLKLSKTIIFPVHPRTERRLREFDLMGKLEGAEHLRLIKPSSYLDFLFLLSRSRLVLTDSGGVQKEAFFLRKPCVTLRENTEWVETVELGWNILVGTGAEKIVEGVENMLSRDLKEVENPFGDGDASKRIVDIVEDGHG